MINRIKNILNERVNYKKIGYLYNKEASFFKKLPVLRTNSDDIFIYRPSFFDGKLFYIGKINKGRGFKKKLNLILDRLKNKKIIGTKFEYLYKAKPKYKKALELAGVKTDYDSVVFSQLTGMQDRMFNDGEYSDNEKPLLKLFRSGLNPEDLYELYTKESKINSYAIYPEETLVLGHEEEYKLEPTDLSIYVTGFKNDYNQDKEFIDKGGTFLFPNKEYGDL